MSITVAIHHHYPETKCSPHHCWIKANKLICQGDACEWTAVDCVCVCVHGKAFNENRKGEEPKMPPTPPHAPPPNTHTRTGIKNAHSFNSCACSHVHNHRLPCKFAELARHYSYFSASTLIALIIVNWLPRSVDPSLPVICLQPDSKFSLKLLWLAGVCALSAGYLKRLSKVSALFQQQQSGTM